LVIFSQYLWYVFITIDYGPVWGGFGGTH